MCAKFDADRFKILGLVRKSRFFKYRDVAKKKSRRKWAWPMSRHSISSPEHEDMKFLKMGLTGWKL